MQMNFINNLHAHVGSCSQSQACPARRREAASVRFWQIVPQILSSLSPFAGAHQCLLVRALQQDNRGLSSNRDRNANILAREF